MVEVIYITYTHITNFTGGVIVAACAQCLCNFVFLFVCLFIVIVSSILCDCPIVHSS